MSAQPKSIDQRVCEACGASTAGYSYARFCDPCRSLRRRKKVKYQPNDFIDQQLRRIYQERLQRRSSPIPGIRALARKIGWPRHTLQKRARELRLTRPTDDRAWSEREIAILERFAWMSTERIQMRLRTAGFERTCNAIKIKLSHLSLRQNTPFMSANQLSECFGVDRSTILRWIRHGYLKARYEEERQKWLIHENDVRRFVVSHPVEFDIRKVDQLWFLNMITEGKIAC
ncbi:MAG: helix-turn-helix domain-containing protein [Acidobacteriota bacterium]